MLTLAACSGDDEGISPYHPERDIAGTWVRYQPATGLAVPSTLVAFADTLTLFGPGQSAWWSRANPMSAGPTPLREGIAAYLEPGGIVPRLYARCTTCWQGIPEEPGSFDPSQWAESYLVIRDDADHPVLVSSADVGSGGRASGQYYRRVVRLR